MSRTDQLRVALIVKTCLSFLSLIGSGYIIQHVLRSPTRRKRVFTRIMLGMSTMDFIFAVWSLTAVLQMPPERDLPWAKGNWPTCVAFGFLVVGSGLSSALYNGMLALHYLLIIRYRWHEPKCKEKAELWMHLLPLGIGWGCAIVGLPLKVYNPLVFGCWIGGYPFGCESKGTCTRGVHAEEFAMATSFGCIWVVYIWIVIAMILIYRSVARAEKASHKFRPGTVMDRHGSNRSNSDRNNVLATDEALQRTHRRTAEDKIRLRKAFAVQALLYCLAYILTWIFVTASAILIKTTATVPVAVVSLSASLSSLQGFWNALIYIRPRYLTHRRKQQQEQGQQQQQGGHDQVSNNISSGNYSRSLSRYPRYVAFAQAVSVLEDDDDDIAMNGSSSEIAAVERPDDGSQNNSQKDGDKTDRITPVQSTEEADSEEQVKNDESS